MPEHIRSAIDAISRRLEPSRHLTSLRVPLTAVHVPARVASTRRDWLLLSDGRPALLINRRPR
jgi:hypothetical protein